MISYQEISNVLQPRRKQTAEYFKDTNNNSKFFINVVVTVGKGIMKFLDAQICVSTQSDNYIMRLILF